MTTAMQPHALNVFAAELESKHGTPRVLDVEHSIQANKPSLSGTPSPSSYYIRPPEGMTVDELIAGFEAVPGFEKMNLTLTSILGIDTYHQPLISADDFARKYFHDNQQRILRVVGKTDAAIEAMAAFVEGLKKPFSLEMFPRASDFLISGYRPPVEGKSAEVKLLFKPADPNALMRLEREVKLHLAEFNLGREIHVARHATRDQAPELILASHRDAGRGHDYLAGLAESLPKASSEDVAEAKRASERTAPVAETVHPRATFSQPAGPQKNLPAAELKRKAIGALTAILRESGFRGMELKIGQNGTAVEVEFPRSAKTLWLMSSFEEKKHLAVVRVACTAVRADPALREGWDLHWRFDGKVLQLRAVDEGSRPVGESKPL